LLAEADGTAAIQRPVLGLIEVARLLLELYANEIGEKPEQVLRPIAIRLDERRGALPAPAALTATLSNYVARVVLGWTFSGGHWSAGEWRRSGRSVPVRRLGYGL
jgi:hypothetical protein